MGPQKKTVADPVSGLTLSLKTIGHRAQVQFPGLKIPMRTSDAFLAPSV